MSDDRSKFDEHARNSQQSIFHEFLHFLRHNRKWWLTPIILVLILVSALVILGGTAAAPFIYALF